MSELESKPERDTFLELGQYLLDQRCMDEEDRYVRGSRRSRGYLMPMLGILWAYGTVDVAISRERLVDLYVAKRLRTLTETGLYRARERQKVEPDGRTLVLLDVMMEFFRRYVEHLRIEQGVSAEEGRGWPCHGDNHRPS